MSWAGLGSHPMNKRYGVSVYAQRPKEDVGYILPHFSTYASEAGSLPQSGVHIFSFRLEVSRLSASATLLKLEL